MNITGNIIQSSFQLDNGKKITIFTSGGHIKSFYCDKNWNPIQPPFGDCPLSWSNNTDVEYHLEARNVWHKKENFVSEKSTPLPLPEPPKEQITINIGVNRDVNE